MQRNDLIRVLGPIDLLTEGGPHPIGSRHCRAVLGMLVLGGGRAVSVDRLRGGLWGASPPKSADNSLQTYVSRLRHVVGTEALQHADHAYQLVVERSQIDALRFEDLLLRATEVQAEPQRCQTLCREALALWRGDPFGDLYDDETFRLEARRLEELRLGVMELEMGAELALGNHEIVVAELESAVEEHPFREHLWYLLIEALLRSDRRVDALRACHRLDRQLGEVGVDAGDRLRRIEKRILGVDATLDCGPSDAEPQRS